MSESQPFIERAIAAISPAWAARRAAGRTMLGQVRQHGATYRGGVSTRLATPWGGRSVSYLGGSIRDRQSMADMRDRARVVYRDNPIGRSLVNTETDNIVADGYTLMMRTGDTAFDTEAQERWYGWLERADVRGMMGGVELMRESLRGPRIDGDGGFLLVSSQTGGESKLQYIPADWICNPWGQPNSPTLFDGVEVDAMGRPVRFHIRDQDEFGKLKWTPVDARDFVYLPHPTDPLDIRGTTCYAQIFTLLDQLDGYVDAVVIAARMAAVFGLVFKESRPAAQVNALSTLMGSQGDQQKGVTLENGMVRYIGSDSDVVQVQAQQPMNQTPDFIRAIFRLICLPFDMPLEIGQKDLSQVNFSGGRIGLIGYYRSCRVKQEQNIARCWDRIFRWWIDREVKLGNFTGRVPAGRGLDGRPAFEQHVFHGREWDYTDPVSEAQADLLEISMGIKSPQQAAALRGRDWDDIQRQIEIARKSNQAMGIPNVLSNYTRDEHQKVTAVDAEGNPVGGDNAPLNGVQITAAMDVLAKLAEKTIPSDAAVEMLTRLGIAPDRAQAIAASAQSNRSGISASDRDFQRQVFLKFLDVPQAREVAYNLVDQEDLTAQTGLPIEKGYQAPFAAVVAPVGPLVSGATINDPQGDVVGGDIENEAPMESPTDDGGTRNASAGKTEGNDVAGISANADDPNAQPTPADGPAV